MPGSGERAGETTVREGGTAPRPDSYYWAADLLQENGATVHLVHPLGLHWDGPTIRPVRPKLVNLWARSSLLTRSILCPVRRC
jgi:hypothetical protein